MRNFLNFFTGRESDKKTIEAGRQIIIKAKEVLKQTFLSKDEKGEIAKRVLNVNPLTLNDKEVLATVAFIKNFVTTKGKPPLTQPDWKPTERTAAPPVKPTAAKDLQQALEQLKKHEAILKDLLTLIGELMKDPTAEQVPGSGEVFNRLFKRNNRIDKVAEAMANRHKIKG